MSALPKPKLRVFAESDSDDGSDGLSPEMRLSEFFERYLLPIPLVEASVGTIKEYRATLKHWTAATADPPLALIDDYTIAKFRSWLSQHKHREQLLAAQTRRKHLVNLQFMLDRAGPTRSRDVPTAQLLTEVFAIPKPANDDDEVEDAFTLDEIASYLSACQFADFPDELPPTLSPCCFWRCAGLLAYNTALRLKPLLALRWEWIKTDDWGTWFDIPGVVMKKKRRFRCYVNVPAQRVLTRLRSTKSELVLPWTLSEGWFHKCRKRLFALSSIKPERQFGFHAFRKACATELGMINGSAADLQLGHKTRNVRLENYTHRRLLVEAHTRLPQPPWHGDLDGRQGLLFA